MTTTSSATSDMAQCASAIAKVGGLEAAMASGAIGNWCGDVQRAWLEQDI